MTTEQNYVGRGPNASTSEQTGENATPNHSAVDNRQNTSTPAAEDLPTADDWQRRLATSQIDPSLHEELLKGFAEKEVFQTPPSTDDRQTVAQYIKALLSEHGDKLMIVVIDQSTVVNQIGNHIGNSQSIVGKKNSAAFDHSTATVR